MGLQGYFSKPKEKKTKSQYLGEMLTNQINTIGRQQTQQYWQNIHLLPVPKHRIAQAEHQGNVKLQAEALKRLQGGNVFGDSAGPSPSPEPTRVSLGVAESRMYSNKRKKKQGRTILGGAMMRGLSPLFRFKVGE